ncbi:MULTISPECIES: hypothetical protein [Mycolicibacterium]|uniref:hypothetical protein n=1 Tax=Mycolicibacterium TaxID=1866885 RepID=UPI000959C63F|nr:hypothetical protein [Mycolicibacterium mageritense]OKH77773.1 membrane protein [Mycobacterium sp. SWH-M3]
MTAGRVTPEPEQDSRPADVDTGFWLWVVAVPLMVAAFVLDVVTTPGGGEHRALVVAVAVMFVVVLTSIVVAFLILMRHGYRWTRTLLTSGGVVSAVHAVSSLVTVDRVPAVAVAYAFTTIVGSVLIAGGIYLLHRRDATGFFTR